MSILHKDPNAANPTYNQTVQYKSMKYPWSEKEQQVTKQQNIKQRKIEDLIVKSLKSNEDELYKVIKGITIEDKLEEQLSLFNAKIETIAQEYYSIISESLKAVKSTPEYTKRLRQFKELQLVSNDAYTDAFLADILMKYALTLKVSNLQYT